MKKSISQDLRFVTFTYDDGVLPYIVDCDKIAPELKGYCVPFAVGHRVGDNAAIPRKAKDGSVVNVTEAMRREACAEAGDYMMSGVTEWNMKAGPRVIPQNPIWVQIAAKRGLTYEAYVAERVAADLAELSAE